MCGIPKQELLEIVGRLSAFLEGHSVNTSFRFGYLESIFLATGCHKAGLAEFCASKVDNKGPQEKMIEGKNSFGHLGN